MNKAKRRILKAYKIMLSHIDKNYTIEYADRWCCIPEQKKIFTCLLEDVKSNCAFKETIYRELVKQHRADLFYEFRNNEYMFSLIHEIGHCINPQTEYNQLGRKLADFCSSKLGLDKLANAIYFNLAEEKEATRLGVQFLIANIEPIRQDNIKINNAYYWFFQGLVDED